MRATRLPALALFASGLAGMAMPERVASVLDLPPASARGRAEARAGLGGTYAALGGWALASDSPAARRAIGVTWLGAAAVRLGALAADEPETDWTYWAYLAGEVVLGVVALGGSVAKSRSRPA